MKAESIKGMSWKKSGAVSLIRCLAFCLAVSLLAACGKREGQGTGTEEAGVPDSGQLYCHFQETALPAYEGIPNVFEQEYTVSGNVSRLCGDIFYHCIQYSTVEEPFQQKNYIQVLKPPYQDWETEEVGSGRDVPVSILGETEGKLVILMREDVLGEDRQKGQEDQGGQEDPGTQTDQEEYEDGNDSEKSTKDQGAREEDDSCTYYLALWQPGTKSLERVPDSGYEGEKGEFSADGEFFLTSAGETVYYDYWRQGTVALYDEQFHLKGEKNLGEDVRVCGILQDPENGRLLWYGMRDGKAGVWELEDGTPVLKGGQTLERVNAGNFHGVYDAEGVLYLADGRFLWRVEDGEAEEACSFFDRDYPMTTLYTMEASENGGLLLRIQCAKELLLRIEENQEPLPEKQEIIIASKTLYNALETAIGEFNRMSERYRVKVEYPYDPYGPMPADAGELSAEFWRKLQMEFSAGRGPDLYLSSSYSREITALAEEGYLQSLEGVLEDEEDFWPAAMEVGKIGGVQYGLPYFAHLYLTAYSRKNAGERRSFTLPELMEAVRESGAEILQWGYGGTDIVLWYGLYDNDNRDFIDWEAGESHLKEKPFQEFLEFAGEYADPVRFEFPNWEDAARIVADGKTFAAHNFMAQSWGTIWSGDTGSLETIFQGDPVCIGYPRSEGNGIYVDAPMFLKNAHSESAEGVKEFLRFLLSKENQRLFLTDIIIDNVGTPPQVPVRLSVLEESIELARERKEQGAVGDSFLPTMTEEQAREARFLIENAQPANWKVSEIEDIFYEELPLYFEGRRSLEETLDILDNRVQLYLDEKK